MFKKVINKLPYFRYYYPNNIFENLNLIFVHIPRTSGTSISLVLNKLNKIKNNQSELKKINRFYISSRANHYKHDKVIDYLNFLNKKNINSNKINFVTIIRNPWDWYNSSYYWYKKYKYISKIENYQKIKDLKFDDFIEYSLKNRTITNTTGMQFDYFTKNQNIKLKIFKFEEKNFSKFLKKNYKLKINIPISNKYADLSYKKNYSSKSKDMVYKYYKNFIKKFKYFF